MQILQKQELIEQNGGYFWIQRPQTAKKHFFSVGRCYCKKKHKVINLKKLFIKVLVFKCWFNDVIKTLPLLRYCKKTVFFNVWYHFTNFYSITLKFQHDKEDK